MSMGTFFTTRGKRGVHHSQRLSASRWLRAATVVMVTIGFQIALVASEGLSPGSSAPIAFAAGSDTRGCGDAPFHFPFQSFRIGWLYLQPPSAGVTDTNDGKTKGPNNYYINHTGIDVWGQD